MQFVGLSNFFAIEIGFIKCQSDMETIEKIFMKIELLNKIFFPV